MADHIVYRFTEMETAAQTVDDYASQYKNAATSLVESVGAAVADWEGEAQVKFLAFLNGTVHEYIHKTVPELVAAVSRQIRDSSKHMAETDAKLAESIPQ